MHKGVELQLGSISLNYVSVKSPDASYQDIDQQACIVKVWLDFEHQSSLICTLRSGSCEQLPLHINLCRNQLFEGDEAHSAYTLRMEVSSLSKRKAGMMMEEDYSKVARSYYEVHVLGMCTIAENGGDEDGGEEEEEEHVDSGACPHKH